MGSRLNDPVLRSCSVDRNRNIGEELENFCLTRRFRLFLYGIACYGVRDARGRGTDGR